MKPNKSANSRNSFGLNRGRLSDTRRSGIPKRANMHFNFAVTVCSEHTAGLFEQSLPRISATKWTGALFLGISLCLGVPREFSEGRQLASNGE